MACIRGGVARGLSLESSLPGCTTRGVACMLRGVARTEWACPVPGGVSFSSGGVSRGNLFARPCPEHLSSSRSAGSRDGALERRPPPGHQLPTLVGTLLRWAASPLHSLDPPLASQVIHKILDRTSSGSFTSNDGFVFLSQITLPFGGVGEHTPLAWDLPRPPDDSVNG